MTAERAIKCSNATPQNLVAVTSQGLQAKTGRHLVYEAAHVLGEPEARNTAAAIALAAGYADRTFGASHILWIMPSDHVIQDHAALSGALKKAVMAAEKGYIATFGIQPDHPETAYGYIQPGPAIGDDVYHIESFTEKPQAMIAKRYLNDGSYLWNSGMFVCKAGVLIREFEKLAPDYMPALRGKMDGYEELPSLPFDRAIMEQTAKAAVIPLNAGWSDIGTYRNLLSAKLQKQKKAA